MADWKSEARNLPTWPGAFAYFPASESAELVVDAGDGWAFNDNEFGIRIRAELVALALDHPDTQAAYLRRLAIRLGCPEEVAREGVMFAKRDNAWVVYAGWSPSSWGWTWAVGCTFEPEKLTTDRLLALVRAWRVADDG